MELHGLGIKTSVIRQSYQAFRPNQAAHLVTHGESTQQVLGHAWKACGVARHTGRDRGSPPLDYYIKTG